VRRVCRRALALLTVLAAGCGGGETKRPREAPAVTGAVDVEAPRAGAPDAGTRAGHGNDGAVGTTNAAVFSFTGTVRPADSRLRVSEGVVRVEPSGRFTVAVASPRSGAKRVRIEASRSGSRPWSTDVRVVRGSPATVEVPERDTEAPTAALLVEPGAGAGPVVQASPARARERPEVVTLPRPSFRATAVVRDAEGGTGRIRLAVVTTTRCGRSERRRVRLLPPAHIVRIAIPPGARAPVERSRSARFRLEAGAGCTVRGEAFAEGTDAHGRQAVTRHAGFRYP
jgi:hypothetical protein